MSRGFVYILSNPFMPDVVKIGKTTRSVEQRANELFQTGLPAPFTVENYFYSPDCDELEAVSHRALSKFRVSDAREFFKISPTDAFGYIDALHQFQVKEWLQEFMPDHNVSHHEMVVGAPEILKLSEAVGAHPFEIVSAIETLTEDEVLPLLDRWRLVVAERAARRVVVVQ